MKLLGIKADKEKTGALSVQELDAYLLEYVRYLYKGRHYKGNYTVTYDTIKSWGFRSLRHEYYLSRRDSSSESEALSS